MNALRARRALLPQGWVDDLSLRCDAAGQLLSLQPGSPPAREVRTLLPRVPNLHSHAFQRAIVGRTEVAGAQGDDFWSWREQMYRVALSLDPDGFEALATQVYRELRAGGYGAVCEFHYLHHAPDGVPYADPAELSLRLVRAAQAAGLQLTLLPVLYSRAGFDQPQPRPEQRRFVHSLEHYLTLVEDLRSRLRGASGVAVGIAAHSLRAVSLAGLHELAAWRRATDPTMPFHAHLSEQTAEVDACLARHGATPIELFADTIDGLDPGCCLVHATHATDAELRLIATSGATVALCPSTEANLGDGLFPLAEFAALGGRWGVGSDSQVCRSAVAELRLAEYGQRLRLRRRCVLAPPGSSTGEALWQAACADKDAVCGLPVGRLAVGLPLDALELQIGVDQWLFDEGP